MVRFDVYANAGPTPDLLETPKMGAARKKGLKSPVTSLEYAHDQITAALDFLFQG